MSSASVIIIIIIIIIIIAGDGPFPGVVDMFGTAGGLYDIRAALLASRGFAGLSLAFFGYEDLPENMALNIEYFVVNLWQNLLTLVAYIKPIQRMISKKIKFVVLLL